MFLHRKALYNLIQLNLEKLEGEGRRAKLEPWQLENYREFATEELFARLYSLRILLDPKDFEMYARSFDTPEELTGALCEDMDPLATDRAYLLIFELWRRLFPEKQSLSVFCDELDYQIGLYDLEQVSSPTAIQDAVAYLQHILDENVDEGVDPKTSFASIQHFCANDLESFLYEYILDQIEEGCTSYASELLEGFSPYVGHIQKFCYLKVRLEIHSDPEEGYLHLEELVLNKKNSDLELGLDILFFVAKKGNQSFFAKGALRLLPLLTTQEDFHEFTAACELHFKNMNHEPQAHAVAILLEGRPENGSLSSEDPALAAIKKILQDAK